MCSCVLAVAATTDVAPTTTASPTATATTVTNTDIYC